MIDPRAVATLGIGFWPAQVAVIGLLPASAPVTPDDGPGYGGRRGRRGRRRSLVRPREDIDAMLLIGAL